MKGPEISKIEILRTPCGIEFQNGDELRLTWFITLQLFCASFDALITIHRIEFFEER